MSVRQVKAPREDGAVVAEPPLADVGRLLRHNRQILAEGGPEVFGRPWHELREQARRAVLAAARAYLREAGEPVPSADGVALLMAGHQPELFHPGVWVKNFALHGLARTHGGVAVNLVVDNDTAKSASLRLPIVAVPLPPTTDAPPHLGSVAFDRWTAEAPWEERTVQDEALFASFAERVQTSWNFEPLLPDFWREVLRQAKRTPLVGERLVAARRALERRWGCHNLEVPVSAVCRTEPFARFACHLLSDLPRLHEAYNGAVRDYRARYGLRSKNHPVPDLAREGDWLEAPFWAWRAGRPRRERLMARRTADALDLRAGAERWPSLPLGRPEAAVAAWLDLERQGLKVRSRALTNTIFARLFLCDLFVHGIGGGKYDEVTDAIVRRFYRVEPPGYLVLSATLRLPLPNYPARPDDCHALRRQARDLFWNPQRHLDGEEMADLVERKQALIEAEPTDKRRRRQWFHDLRVVTENLRTAVEGRLSEARRRREECERQTKANEVLQRRDYAFCLYPEEVLRAFCARFL